MRLVYLNGRLVPEDQATVSVFDAGLQHGVGLFETLRTYSGAFYRLADHVDRMLASADALKLQLNIARDELISAVKQTVTENELADARVRITVTRGRISADGG